VVDWVEQADRMTLQCECAASDSALAAAIEASIRSICKLRGAVEIVTPGSLPNDGKVIDDVRQYD
jgi:phenylacetate-CoA ligase